MKEKKKKQNIAYIGFGSNKGDRLSYIKNAASEITKDGNCKIVKFSSIYETKPFGVKDQSNFFNAVVKIETELSIQELFRFIKKVEKKLGRKNTFKWGPREIDLDLLFYNNCIFSEENLTVPHPGIQERDFVLIPMTEIEPTLFHPVLEQKISDIYIMESEKNIIRILNEEFL